MLEIESKIKVAELESTRRRLRALNAVFVGTYLETNSFFDTPDHRLRLADSGLRLRRKRDLSNQEEQLILTYKGPRLPGNVKMREERELIVACEQDAVALLESLGYTPILKFEKHRESWKFLQCQIELDELPEIGFFVEVEGPDESSVQLAARSLGLAASTPVRESYPELVQKHRKQV